MLGTEQRNAAAGQKHPSILAAQSSYCVADTTQASWRLAGAYQVTEDARAGVHLAHGWQRAVGGHLRHALHAAQRLHGIGKGGGQGD